MERLEHEPRTQVAKRSDRPLEWYEVEARLGIERRYQADPKVFHARLIYQGYWRIAAQLKTDYEAGRLSSTKHAGRQAIELASSPLTSGARLEPDLAGELRDEVSEPKMSRAR